MKPLGLDCPRPSTDDNGRHTTTPSHPSAGRLTRLLLIEIVQLLLLAMDVPTLTTFRRASRGAMALVDSLREYRQIVQHCPDILRAVLSLRAGSYSLGVLYDTLSSMWCSSSGCGSKPFTGFGGYLYLVTCERVCFFCLRNQDDYVPLTKRSATLMTGIPARDLPDRVPQHFLGLPAKA